MQRAASGQTALYEKHSTWITALIAMITLLIFASCNSMEATCSIGPVPESLHLDARYTKACSSALPVVTSDGIPDAALVPVGRTLDHLFAGRRAWLDALAKENGRVAILGESELITQLPEFAGEKGKWFEQA